MSLYQHTCSSLCDTSSDVSLLALLRRAARAEPHSGTRLLLRSTKECKWQMPSPVARAWMPIALIPHEERSRTCRVHHTLLTSPAAPVRQCHRIHLRQQLDPSFNISSKRGSYTRFVMATCHQANTSPLWLLMWLDSARTARNNNSSWLSKEYF